MLFHYAGYSSLLAAVAAAAVLVKLTNVAVFAASGVAVLRKAYRAWKIGHLRDVWASTAVLVLSTTCFLRLKDHRPCGLYDVPL